MGLTIPFYDGNCREVMLRNEANEYRAYCGLEHWALKNTWQMSRIYEGLLIYGEARGGAVG